MKRIGTHLEWRQEYIKPSNLSPKPSTLNLKPETLNTCILLACPKCLHVACVYS
jgi:hypothetical protein